MFELHPSDFHYARTLFFATRYGALAAGTIEGGHPGRVFVDQVDQPAVGLVATRVGYYFLAGDPARAGDRLRSLFLDTLVPDQLRRLGDPQVLLFYDQPEWKPALSARFADKQPITIFKKRMVLAHGGANLPVGLPKPLPEGYNLRAIDAGLLADHAQLSEEVCWFWGSPDQFQKRSLGFCLIDPAGAVACSCLGVFAGAGEIEISIATAEEHRRRGFGWITARAFLDECQRRQVQPVWGCWPENEPSVALAKSLGFTEDIHQEVCFWEETDGSPAR